MQDFHDRLNVSLTQLSRNEQRYRTLVESSAVIVWVANPDGTNTESSPSWLAYTGQTRTEEAGHGWIACLHPEDRDRVLAEWREAMPSKSPCETECRIRRHDGVHRLFKLRGVPVLDDDGSIREWVGTCADITNRKQAEAELARAQKELLEASRLAGMADVATGVIHNIGNVLNSINIASSCVAEGLKKSKAANLRKLVAILKEHEGDLPGFFATDPRARQITAYLGKLADHLNGEQADALNELTRLQKSVEHSRDIVSMQQNYARNPGVTEQVRLPELIEDALNMNVSGLLRNEINLVRDIRPMPPVALQKHKLLQILVNLLRNAKDACTASPSHDKKILISAGCVDGQIRISVTDNGVGIAPANLARIFSHGFTTKKDGHGFGLHSSALAASEMGGTLTANSDGPGRGATFTITLPLKP